MEPKVEYVSGRGDDGRPYIVVKTTTYTRTERRGVADYYASLPSYRLQTGERLTPEAQQGVFRVLQTGVVVMLDG